MKDKKKIRVMIVEDELIVAHDISNLLTRLGHDVVSKVSSGKEAIEKSIEAMPDLIMMDIKLKGNIDGIDTVMEIRKRFPVPVVYLTAYADTATLQRAKKTEPFNYLLKPFEEEDVKLAIDVAIHNNHLERKLSLNLL